MSARVPVVDALVRNVAQLVADDDRLRHSGSQADRRYLVGIDRQYVMPDRLALPG